jgi:hypothetical protein
MSFTLQSRGVAPSNEKLDTYALNEKDLGKAALKQ